MLLNFSLIKENTYVKKNSNWREIVLPLLVFYKSLVCACRDLYCFYYQTHRLFFLSPLQNESQSQEHTFFNRFLFLEGNLLVWKNMHVYFFPVLSKAKLYILDRYIIHSAVFTLLLRLHLSFFKCSTWKGTWTFFSKNDFQQQHQQ